MHTIKVIESRSFPYTAEERTIKEYYDNLTVADAEALTAHGFRPDRNYAGCRYTDMLSEDECQIIIDRLRSQGIDAELTRDDEDDDVTMYDIVFPVTRMVYRPVLTEDDLNRLARNIAEKYSDDEYYDSISITAKDIQDGEPVDTVPEYIYGARNTAGYTDILIDYVGLFYDWDYQRLNLSPGFVKLRELNHITVFPGNRSVLAKVVGDRIQIDLVEIIPSSYDTIYTFSRSSSRSYSRNVSDGGRVESITSVDGEMVFTTNKDDAVRALDTVNGMVNHDDLPVSQEDIDQRRLFLCFYPVPMKMDHTPPVAEMVEKLSRAAFISG